MAEADWIRVQRKTFTRWCNSHLVDRNIVIEHLENSFEDGTVLHSLLEILGGVQLPKAVKQPKTSFQKIQNLNYSFAYMKQEQIKLVAIGPEDIMNKNSKLILGLIWTLILKFQISKAEFGDDANAGPKKALLEWCNKVLNPQGVIVKDFTSSWQDGVAFCGLVNVLQPGEIDLPKLDKDAKLDNMNKAFNKSEELFQIAKLLDAEDVLKTPDELSVMSYVSLFRAYLGTVSPIPEFCTAEGPGLTEAVVKEKAFYTVTTRNEEKQLITRGGANISGWITGPDGKKNKVLVKDKLNGTYECYYIATQSGEHILEILVTGHPIPTSPYKPVAKYGGPFAIQCEASGPGISKAIAGQSAEFKIQAKDERGNLLEEGGAVFPSTFKDPSGDITVDIKDNNDGTYAGSYIAKTTGKSPLIILLKTDEGDKGIKDSPFTVLVLPGPLDASQVEVSGKGLEVVVAGETGEFDAQAKDGFGNKLTQGGNKLEAKLEGPANVDTKATDNNDGTYKVTYVPTVTGDYKLHVNFDGSQIPRSPFGVKVIPAAASASTTEAEGDGLKGAVAGEEEKIAVQTKDKFGNKLTKGGDKVTATMKGPQDVPVEVKDNGDGTYTLTYDPQAAGEYTLEIKLGNENIKDSPFKVTVTPAAGDASNAVASGKGLEVVVAGETGEFSVQAKDKLGNNLISGGNKLEAKIEGPSEVEVNSEDNGDGTYKATYVPTVTGDYKLSVNFDGSSIPKSPFGVKVIPAAASAANTEAHGDGLNKAVAGEEEKITVQTKDKFGNKLTKGGDKINSILKGAEDVLVEVKDNDNGTYTLIYDAKIAGEYTLDIKLGDEDIKDAPFKVTVAPAAGDASNAVASGKGLEVVVAGETGEFSVQAKDKFGNNLISGGNKVEAKIEGPSEVEVKTGDNGDGTYKGEFVPTIVGDYKLSVNFDGSSIPKSPFGVKVIPAAASAENTEAHGEGLNKAMAGVENGFKVQARDRFNNNLTQGGDEITASILPKDDADAEPVKCEVKDNNDGTYDVSYPALNKAGDYVVSVKLKDDETKDAPHALHVDPNSKTAPGNCYVEGIQDMIAGVPQTIVVHSVDAYGNHSIIGGNKVVVKLSGTADITAEVTDNKDGTYTAVYAPTIAGKYTIDVKVNDEDVKDNPFGIVVSPAEVNSIHCIASGPGLTQAKCAKDAHFALQLKDKYDNDVKTGEGTKLESQVTQDGLEPVKTKVHDNKDGTYACTYHLTKPGSWKLHVHINGADIHSSPFTLKVTPGQYHVPNTKVEVKDGVAGKPGTKILLNDVHNNPRHKGGQQVRAVMERPYSQDSNGKDNTDGTYNLVYPPDAKGEYTVKMFVGDEEVPGGPFTVKVEENPVPEEMKNSLKETFPKSGTTLSNLLLNATDEDREAFMGEVSALKSGVAPSDANAAEESEKLKDHVAKLQQKEEKLKEHNNQLENQLKEKSEVVDKLEKELESAKAAAASSSSSEPAPVQADNSVADKLQQDLNAAQQKSSELAKQAEELADENERLKQDLADVKAAASAANAASKKKDDSSESENEEANKLKNELEEKEKENEELRKQLAEKSKAAANAAESDALKGLLSTKDKENTELHDKLSNAEQEKESLAQQVAALQKQLEDAKAAKPEPVVEETTPKKSNSKKDLKKEEIKTEPVAEETTPKKSNSKKDLKKEEIKTETPAEETTPKKDDKKSKGKKTDSLKKDDTPKEEPKKDDKKKKVDKKSLKEEPKKEEPKKDDKKKKGDDKKKKKN